MTHPPGKSTFPPSVLTSERYDTSARLLAICGSGALPECDAEFMRQLAIELGTSPARRRMLRLDARDDAVRDLLGTYGGSLRANAQACEADIVRYLTTSWLRDRDLETVSEKASPRRSALHRFARLNHGQALGWRQIVNIGTDRRA